MIVVVDYGRGNLFSLGQALRQIDADYRISSDPGQIEQADKIILPGVGAFGDAIQGLKERGLVEPLRTAVGRSVPFLGICVGCQLLLTRGEEFGLHDGLDLIPGTVSRLPSARGDGAAGDRIPNVGWRQLQVRDGCPVIGGQGAGEYMYFVHSFVPVAAEAADIAATIRFNDTDVPVAVQRGSVTGVQFHPEKSGPDGLRLLGRFLAQAA